MDKDTAERIFKRIKQGQEYAIVGENTPQAVLPLHRSGVRKAIALMPGITPKSYRITQGDVEELDDQGKATTPSYMETRPLGDFIQRPNQPAQPISEDDIVFGMKDAPTGLGQSGAQVHIGQLIIQANSHAEGKAAERGFIRGLAQRGIQIVR